MPTCETCGKALTRRDARHCRVHAIEDRKPRAKGPRTEPRADPRAWNRSRASPGPAAPPGRYDCPMSPNAPPRHYFMVSTDATVKRCQWCGETRDVPRYWDAAFKRRDGSKP